MRGTVILLAGVLVFGTVAAVQNHTRTPNVTESVSVSLSVSVSRSMPMTGTVSLTHTKKNNTNVTVPPTPPATTTATTTAANTTLPTTTHSNVTSNTTTPPPQQTPPPPQQTPSPPQQTTTREGGVLPPTTSKSNMTTKATEVMPTVLSSTFATTMTPAPTGCVSTNPVCTDSCYCNGRGTATSYSYGTTNYCWCHCRDEWYGTRCNECKPGYVLSGDKCVKCSKVRSRLNSPVLHGRKVSVAVPYETTITQCKTAFTDIYYSLSKYDGTTSSWSSGYLGVQSTVSYTGDCAASNIQSYAYYSMIVSGYWVYFWSPECVATPSWLTSTVEGAVQMKELTVSKVTMLVMSAESCYATWTGDNQCYGFSVTQYLKIATALRPAVKGTTTLTHIAGGEKKSIELAADASLDDVATAFSKIYEASDNGDNQCTAYEARIDDQIAATAKSTTARSELVVLPDIRACRSTSVNTKITSLSKRTNVILIPVTTYFSYSTSVPEIPNQDTPYFTLTNNADAAVEQFLVTRFTTPSSKCSNDNPRIVPTSVPLFESSLLMVRDICGVLVKCCFGDLCNTAIRSPPACVVPIGAATAAGERSVTLHVYTGGKESVVKVQRPLVFLDTPIDFYAYGSYYAYNDYAYAYRSYSAQRSDLRCPVLGLTDVANNHSTSSIAAPNNGCAYQYSYSYSYGSYYYQYGYSYTWGEGARNYFQGFPTCINPHQIHSAVAVKAFPKLLPLPKSDVQTVADSLENGVTVEAGFVRPKPSDIGAPTSSARSVGDRSLEETLAVAVQYAIDTALDASEGLSMQHVRDALLTAGVQSAAEGEPRTCDASSQKLGATSCQWAWSENAAQAGKYLLAAGFEEVATSWLTEPDGNGNYIENAKFGDVAVIPALPASASKEKLEKGHVQMMFKGGWVSDVVQDATGFPYQAVKEYVQSRQGAKVKPALYRLTTAIVQGTDGVALGSAWFYPVATCEGFCKTWASKAVDLSSAITHFNTYYQCPASGTDWVPAELSWRWWINGYFCFAMQPSSLVNGVGVRCCYDRNTRQYIASYPSMIGYLYEQWNRRATTFLARADGFAEQQCCMNAADNTTCAGFAGKRPAPQSTNTPFTSPFKWTIGIRWANAFGDPHCMSHDGTEFECNFRGEATYAFCDKWRVHVVATALGGGASSGTIATAVAIKSGNDVVYVNASSEKNVSVAMNDLAQAVDVNKPTTLGAFTAFAESYDTIEIQDADGNAVQVTAAGAGAALNVAVRVGKTCQKRTNGLLGNADGVSTNDFVPRGATSSVSSSLSQRELYTQFVSTWVITNAEESILPNSIRVATTTAATASAFAPVFGDEIDVSNCPSTCKGVKTCCFDASQGYPATASLTGSSKATTLNDNTVGVGSTATPPQIIVPTQIKAADQATITVVAFAGGASTIKTLDCSVCAAATCSITGLDTTNATLEFAKSGTMRVTCTATNKEGMKATAVTDLTNPDVLSFADIVAGYLFVVGIAVVVLAVAVIAIVCVCKSRAKSTAQEKGSALGQSKNEPNSEFDDVSSSSSPPRLRKSNALPPTAHSV